MIQDKVNKVLMDEEKNREPYQRSSGIYWPSQASAILADGSKVGMCHRQGFYQIKGVPATNFAALTNIRQRGTGKAIEEFEIGVAKKAGIFVQEQVPFMTQYKNIFVRGKMDALYNIESNLKGVEYKTGSGYMFERTIWGTETIGGSPKPTHLMQGMLYVDHFKDHKEFKFDELFLVYVDRGSGKDQEFSIKLKNGYPVINDELDESINVTSIYERFVALDKYLVRNTLPPCDYNPLYTETECNELYSEKKITKSRYLTFCSIGFGQDFACEYCNWANKCRTDRSIG